MIPSIQRCGTGKINLWYRSQTLVVSESSELPTGVDQKTICDYGDVLYPNFDGSHMGIYKSKMKLNL